MVVIKNYLGIINLDQDDTKDQIRDPVVITNLDQGDTKDQIRDLQVIILDHILQPLLRVLLRQQQDSPKKQKLLKLWLRSEL